MGHDENRTIDFAREASLGIPGSIKQVADFLLSEGTGIAGMTMRQIAASAYTSKPTLVRFAKQAGYAGWKDYRHDFLVAAAKLEEEQSQRADVDVNFPFQAGAPADEAFEGIARIHQLAIDEVRHSLDRDALSQAADAILGAHDVAFFGAMQNYHLGRVFASNLGIMGTLCRTPTGEEAAAVAGHLTQGDCLVVASYSGGLTGVSMALVPQETRLFTASVLDNLRYGRLDATDQDCIRAAQIVGADDFIRRLPRGYHTVLSPDGGNLSQGERQLLAIARAAVANPPVLVLDEATSSVDTRTEQLVQRGMNRLMQGRTTFVIAHRLSTVRDADQIIVLDHGRVIENGTHHQLLGQHGKYRQLCQGNEL